MAKIQGINAREILDSRGIPTIEGRLQLDSGQEVFAVASSGESLGKYEGIELRDRNDLRYSGRGVLKAVSYINDLLSPKLIGVNPERQTDIDLWLLSADGSSNGSVLGVNTMMVVSQLLLKAAAVAAKLPLYSYINQHFNTVHKKTIKVEGMPGVIFNFINGGKHGTKNVEFQEFQVIPTTSIKFNKSLEMAASIYETLKKVLDYRNAGTSVSEEGGFTPTLLTNADALDVLSEALSQRKIRLGVDAFLGLDIAASQFAKGSTYTIRDKPNAMSSQEYIQYLNQIAQKYSILILEDPLNDEDFEGWKQINEQVGSNTYVVGDDFVAGNTERIKKAIQEHACSAILFKFNQVPTISNMLEHINMTQEAGFKVIFSQRLGESNDDILADMAVGLQANFVKFGAPVRGERVAKYNRLLAIEKDAKFD